MRKTFPRAELADVAHSEPLRWEPVRGRGYGTNTAKWTVELADGRRIFVKCALDDRAAGWLRTEAVVYRGVEAPFLPAFVGSHDDDVTLLAIEDLSDAHWPPPWTAAQIELTQATLDVVHATTPPDGLPTLESLRDALDGWPTVAAEPEPFLATGLCSRAWLEDALPELAQASRECPLEGDGLVHLDFRSDNACFRNGEMRIVDWNLACVGNGFIDVVVWLPSLRLEGGPEPWEIVDDSRGLASLFGGFLAARAGLPPPATAPTVREFQRAQLEVALPWIARELGIDPPTLQP